MGLTAADRVKRLTGDRRALPGAALPTRPGQRAHPYEPTTVASLGAGCSTQR